MSPAISLLMAPRFRVPAIALWIMLALVATPSIGWAEQYLTIPEAQKLCFPTADRFNGQTIRFTAADIKTIESRTRAKVKNRGNRVWNAHQGTNQLGVLILDQVLGKNEIIDYVVAISPAGTVLQVEIMEYRESHGYEIRSAKWRDQFKGKSADSRLKLNDDVFNLSGATISCRQVTEGIKRVLVTHDLLLRPRPASADGLPKPPSGPKD